MDVKALYALLTLCGLLVDPKAPVEHGELRGMLEWAVEWEVIDPWQVDHYMKGCPPGHAARIILHRMESMRGYPYLGHQLPHPALWLLLRNEGYAKQRVEYFEGQVSLGGYVAEEAIPRLARNREVLEAWKQAYWFMDENNNVRVRREALYLFMKIVGPDYRNGVMPLPD